MAMEKNPRVKTSFTMNQEAFIWESNRNLSRFLPKDRMHRVIILLATYILRRAGESFHQPCQKSNKLTAYRNCTENAESCKLMGF